MTNKKTKMTTLERLAALDENVNNISEDVAEIKAYLIKMDDRFASKLTEKIVYGLCGLILASVTVALISLVVYRPSNKPNTTTSSVHITSSTPPPTATTSVVIRSLPSATPQPTPTPSSPSPQPPLLGVLGLQ